MTAITRSIRSKQAKELGTCPEAKLKFRKAGRDQELTLGFRGIFVL